jgi:hypothetical protein
VVLSSTELVSYAVYGNILVTLRAVQVSDPETCELLKARHQQESALTFSTDCVVAVQASCHCLHQA